MQIINKAIKKNFHILFNLLLILSIYIGFFFDENLTQGPQLDFEHALKQVKAFEENFKYTFLNYDKIENSTRISPVFTSTIYFPDGNFSEFHLILLNPDFRNMYCTNNFCPTKLKTEN